MSPLFSTVITESERRRGFSLVELLVVISIIALLISGTANLLNSDQGSNDEKNALVQVANAFESARQLAISQNTYTYVGFTSPASAQNGADPLCVGVFQSQTGRDVIQNGESATGAQLVSKIAWLRNMTLTASLEPPTGVVPVAEMSASQFSATLEPLTTGQGFTVTRRVGEMAGPAALVFDRVVTFSPNGSAFVDNLRGLPTGLIGFMISPAAGAHKDARTAVVAVNGLLGNARFYLR
jgi:prepilin-type N-terminal cleavage/methylation domain-containing protein